MQFNKVTTKWHPRQVDEMVERLHARWVLVFDFYLYRLNKLLLYDLNEIKWSDENIFFLYIYFK